MNKMNLSLVALIATIPAIGLAVVLAMSFFTYADKMSGALKGLAGGTLAVVAVVVLFPAAILILGAKNKKTDEAAELKPEATEESVADEAEAIDETTEEVSEGFEEEEGFAEAEMGEAVEEFADEETSEGIDVVESSADDEFTFDEELDDEKPA
jgi:flagellar biosynthesis/type III secretory pathway M-ring protein FliF/YscJ